MNVRDAWLFFASGAGDEALYHCRFAHKVKGFGTDYRKARDKFLSISWPIALQDVFSFKRISMCDQAINFPCPLYYPALFLLQTSIMR